jgi:transposase
MTGPERRRRWGDADREMILAAACAPGAVIAEVARRYDVATSLIYKWRRERHAMCGEAAFVPALVVEGAITLPVSAAPSGPAIVVDLARGVRVSIHAGASAVLVSAALKALR